MGEKGEGSEKVAKVVRKVDHGDVVGWRRRLLKVVRERPSSSCWSRQSRRCVIARIPSNRPHVDS